MKAIIMAGGEGTRLRPLTCDCPKPMIRLMNRPVLHYALELLKRHGITDISVTLGYQADAIRDAFGSGDEVGVSLSYTVERTPLGTAGGVRQAARGLDGTFVVLSGDGITDLDITAAVAFHRDRGALATLVLKRADNPLDYGVVLTDPDGRVRSFHEKPDWSEVLSDTVNTGIYILEPQALEGVPEGRACDFGHDLLPELVRRGQPVYGYVTQDYWCDIGDVRAYLKAHADAMEGRIRLDSLLPRPGRATQLPGASVDRAAVLEGPCLIGANARVLAGAYVGPYSVIGDGCVIGERASVKRSVLWSGARLEHGAQARGCVLGANATLGEDAQAYEESVLGTGAALGERAVLLPGVKLWPGKRCADGERLDANLVWGSRAQSGFAYGAMATDSPARAVRAAQAVCAALKPRELLLGRGESSADAAMWHAAAAGAMACGTRVLDAGVCTLQELRCIQRELGCDGAALAGEDRLLPLNALGARLLRRQQRAVAACEARQDFSAPFSGETPPIESVESARALYVARAAAMFDAEPRDAAPAVLCAPTARLRGLAARCFERAGLFARVEDDPTRLALAPGEVAVCLGADGEGFSLADGRGALTDVEQQLLVAWTLLARGEKTLLLPVQATRAAQALAARFDARVEYVSGESALWLNALAERFPAQFALQCDGIAAALAALGTLTRERMTPEDWRRGMPRAVRRSRSMPVAPAQTGRLLRAMARREANVELGGGMRFARDGGWAWICPDEAHARLSIVAEAPDEECARELCDFCESELKRLAAAPGGKTEAGNRE